MEDDLMVDSCEGWHLEDGDRLVGAKDGADALELLEVGVIVASFVGAVFALKAVASAVGLEVVVDWALEGIAEVLRLLELVDRMVEAAGVMVDTAVDGCGGLHERAAKRRRLHQNNASGILGNRAKFVQTWDILFAPPCFSGWSAAGLQTAVHSHCTLAVLQPPAPQLQCFPQGH